MAVVLRLEHSARQEAMQSLQRGCGWVLSKERSSLPQEGIAAAAVSGRREAVQQSDHTQLIGEVKASSHRSSGYKVW